MCSLCLPDICPVLVKILYLGLHAQPAKSESRRPLEIFVFPKYPSVCFHQASLGITGAGHGHRQGGFKSELYYLRVGAPWALLYNIIY